MKTSESTESLFAAIVGARSGIESVPKSGHNNYDGYDYATLEDYVNAITDHLRAHELSVVSSIEDIDQQPNRQTKSGGTEYCVYVRGKTRIIHVSGEWIETSWVGEGQDRADKGCYKAITGGRKYALAALLNLATTDDPEADETVGTSRGSVRSNQNQKAQQSSPPPRQQQSAPPADDGANTGEDVTTIESSKVLKTGEGKRGPWKMVLHTLGSGREVKEFGDDGTTTVAESYSGTGTTVKVAWQRDGEFKGQPQFKLLDVEKAEGAAAPANDSGEEEINVQSVDAETNSQGERIWLVTTAKGEQFGTRDDDIASTLEAHKGDSPPVNVKWTRTDKGGKLIVEVDDDVPF